MAKLIVKNLRVIYTSLNPSSEEGRKGGVKNLICLLFLFIIILSFSGCTFLGVKVGTGDEAVLSNNKRDIGGVFKSIDRAQTFTSPSSNIKGRKKSSISKFDIKDIRFDPQDTWTLYVLTRFDGLWVSYNQAETWERLLKGKLGAIALDPTQRGVIYAAKGNQLKISNDGGSQWTTKIVETVGQDIVSIVLDRQNSRRLLVGTKNGLILESGNGGNSWRFLTRLKVKTLKDIIANPQNFSEMYAVTTLEGIFKSRDGGRNWSLFNKFQEFFGAQDFGQLKLNPSAPSHLYFANKYGLLKSLDAGLTWQAVPILTPPRVVKVRAVGFNPLNEQELYYAVKDTIFRSFDGGNSWSAVSLPTTREVVDILVDKLDSDVVYVGVGSNR